MEGLKTGLQLGNLVLGGMLIVSLVNDQLVLPAAIAVAASVVLTINAVRGAVKL